MASGAVVASSFPSVPDLSALIHPSPSYVLCLLSHILFVVNTEQLLSGKASERHRSGLRCHRQSVVLMRGLWDYTCSSPEVML